MKKIFFAMNLTLLAFAASAQLQQGPNYVNTAPKSITATEVPAEVSTAFGTHPEYTNQNWYSTNNGYMASYIVNGKEYHTVYDKTGMQTATETQFDTKSIPANMNTYWGKNYPGQTIGTVFMIKNADGTISYVTMRGNTRLAFDKDGNYIQYTDKFKK